jgi:hypothetical protein
MYDDKRKGAEWTVGVKGKGGNEEKRKGEKRRV